MTQDEAIDSNVCGARFQVNKPGSYADQDCSMMAIAKKPRINSRQKPILPDAALLDLVQRQTFLYFWDGAHSVSGLARDRVGLLCGSKG